MKHYFADVRDLETIKTIVNRERPDFIFHLAAQPIVSQSYKDPVETFSKQRSGYYESPRGSSKYKLGLFCDIDYQRQMLRKC